MESCESKLHNAFGMGAAIIDCVSSDCESVGVTTLRPQLDAGDR